MNDGVPLAETKARPGTLLIGVTGHRSYRDPERVTAAISAVLDRLLADGSAPIVVTSLAEGADRLVADLVLARGGGAEVILPLPAADYDRDFATTESRRHFADLLARASTTTVVAASECPRELAYELAGQAMIDRSDVVIALWDGVPASGRGGTAATVQYARDHDVMVEIVNVERDVAR